MVYIGTPPGTFVIPVTKAADRAFTVNRNDGSQAATPVDWDASVFMAIDIDPASPTTITATVTGAQAAMLIPADTADQVTNFTAWRMYMQATGESALTTPIAVGKFERDDGG